MGAPGVRRWARVVAIAMATAIVAACSSAQNGASVGATGASARPGGSTGLTSNPDSVTSAASPTDSATAAVTTGSGPTATPTTGGAPLVQPSAYLLVNLEGHLRIIRADGTDGRLAVPSVDVLGSRDEVIAGDWSPDGKQVSFTRVVRDVEPFRASLWVANSDGSGARRVFDCASPCHRAGLGAWSPNGDRIAYTTTELDAARKSVQRNAIEVVTVSTGKRRTVVESNDPVVEFAWPRWSPDSTKLVVQVNRWPAGSQGGTADASASPTVAVVDLARPRTQVPRVVAPNLQGTHPDWNWKTDTILFSTNDPDVVTRDEADRNLWTVRPDGSGLRQVTRFAWPSLAMQPSWNSDGSITFVHCQAQPACFLAYASADGSVVQTPQDLRGIWPRARPAP